MEPTLTNRSHTQFQTKPIHHSPDTYRFRWGHSRTSVFTYLQTTLESVHTEVPLQTKPIHCCPDTDSFRVYSYLVPWAGTKATHSCPHTYNIVSGSVLTKSLQHTDEHQTDSFQISSHGKSFQTFSYQVSYCGNQTIHKLTTQWPDQFLPKVPHRWSQSTAARILTILGSVCTHAESPWGDWTKHQCSHTYNFESILARVPLQNYKASHCCPDTRGFRVHSYPVFPEVTETTHSCPHTYNTVSEFIQFLPKVSKMRINQFISALAQSFRTFSDPVPCWGNQNSQLPTYLQHSIKSYVPYRAKGIYWGHDSKFQGLLFISYPLLTYVDQTKHHWPHNSVPQCF